MRKKLTFLLAGVVAAVVAFVALLYVVNIGDVEDDFYLTLNERTESGGEGLPPLDEEVDEEHRCLRFFRQYPTVVESTHSSIIADLGECYKRTGNVDLQKNLEELLQTVSDANVEDFIRNALQSREIIHASKSGKYRDAPVVSLEPVLPVLHSTLDIHIKATRTGDTSEPLRVYITSPRVAEEIDYPEYYNFIDIPVGSFDAVKHIEVSARGVEIASGLITYEIMECARIVGSRYDVFSRTVPCNVKDSSVATFHLAPRSEEQIPTVTIKPAEAEVPNGADAVFEIVRTGDVSEYLGVSLCCSNSVGNHPGCFPNQDPLRLIIPAGRKTVRYSYPSLDVNVTSCSVVNQATAFSRDTGFYVGTPAMAVVSVLYALPKVGMLMNQQGDREYDTIDAGRGISVSVKRVGDSDRQLTVFMQCTEEGGFIVGDLPTSVTIPAGEAYGGFELHTRERSVSTAEEGKLTCEIQPTDEYVPAEALPTLFAPDYLGVYSVEIR